MKSFSNIFLAHNYLQRISGRIPPLSLPLLFLILFFSHFCAYPAAYLPGIPLGCPTAHAAAPPLPQRYPVFAPLKPLEKQLPAVQTFALNSSARGWGRVLRGELPGKRTFSNAFWLFDFFFSFLRSRHTQLATPHMAGQAPVEPLDAPISPPCHATAACIALSRVKNSISLLAHAKKKIKNKKNFLTFRGRNTYHIPIDTPTAPTAHLCQVAAAAPTQQQVQLLALL